MRNPLVSIVIPVYNGSNYLREAIDSALAQTYDNCEIIVVNDGSTDNTEQICLSYGNCIRYFRKENGGVATALNLGIEKMRGEYFSWLSHDDIYYTEKVSAQIDSLKKLNYTCTIAFSNYNVLNMDDGVTIGMDFEKRYGQSKLQNGVFPVLLGITTGCALLTHKSNFERVGSFNEALKTAQDVDMWFRIFRGQETVFNTERLILIRQHQAQGTKTIKTYGDEQNKISIQHFDAVTGEEVAQLFGDKSNYCYTMMKFFFENQIMDAFEHVTNALNASEMSEGFNQRLLEMREHISSHLDSKVWQICIFGAGINGRGLLLDLILCKIEISSFSDNDPKKWGTLIHGVPCISPKEIDFENTLIVVAMQKNKAVLKQLEEANAAHVITLDKLSLMSF